MFILGVVSTLVRIFLSVDLLFTYALFMFPVSESLEKELFKGEQFGTVKVEIKRNILRAILVGATAAIALEIPYFSLLTGLTGGVGNNLLGFILPPIFYLKLQQRRDYWKWRDPADPDVGRSPLKVAAEIVLNWVICMCGIVVFVLTIIFFTKAIIHANGQK
jgi:amino acid permease